jgi:hypothetical protein
MSFFRDLRVAFHSLKHSKGLAIIVILTLALGIGANAAIFTLVRGVLLKPLSTATRTGSSTSARAPRPWEITTPHSPCPN